jgi:hypothetical protein
LKQPPKKSIRDFFKPASSPRQLEPAPTPSAGGDQAAALSPAALKKAAVDSARREKAEGQVDILSLTANYLSC